jgi:predicted DNA-binding protein (UPF0251 family)
MLFLSSPFFVFSPLDCFCVYAHNQLCDSAQKYIKVAESLTIVVTMGFQHRHRHGRKGRFPKPITIGKASTIDKFSPSPQTNLTPIIIEPAEIEALRLVDLEGLSQEEAGERMGVSRGTIWRLVQSARKKTAQALSEGKHLQVGTGSP